MSPWRPRGRTTTIDVLANDRATNPFPGTPLRVVGVRGLDDSLPDGVSIEPSDDRSTLTVDVGPGAAPVNTTLQYQVADATDDPSRYAWGTVTISVQDRPDPVTGAQVTGFGDGTLDVAFGAGGFNNSPITGYEIALVDPAGSTVLATSTCAATTCTVPTPGNGQANAVLVRVQARNGDRALRSRRGAGSDLVRRDPAAAAGPQGAAARRSAPDRMGARRHRCRQPGRVVRGHGGGRLERGGRRRRMHGLHVRHRVAGHRERQPGAVHGERAQPGVPGPRHVDRGRRQRHAVRARRSRAASPSRATRRPGAVTVSWAPFNGNGDAIGGYYVQRLADGQTAIPSGPQACSVTSPAPGDVVPPASGGSVAEVVQVGPDASSVQFTGTVTESTRYSFVVWGFNRAACANTEVAGIVVRPAPGAVTGVQSDMAWMNQETWDRYIAGVDAGGGPRLQIIAVDANGAQIGQPADFRGTGWLRTLLNRPFGETRAVPGAQLLRVGELRSVVGDHAVDGDAVPHVRAPEPRVERAVQDLVLGGGPRQLRAACDVQLRRRRQPGSPRRPVGDDVPDPERQGRRTGLVGC